jgi:hypothetical protein
MTFYFLPVLPPPVFVLIAMLDAFAGQGSYVIAAANAPTTSVIPL